MHTKILTLPLTLTVVSPAPLPRWRLQLRTWWLGRKGRAVVEALGSGSPVARTTPATQTLSINARDAHARGLLELNLMLERARAAGSVARSAE